MQKQEDCEPYDPPSALAGVVDPESEPSNIQIAREKNVRARGPSYFRNIVPKQHVHDEERSDAFSNKLSVYIALTNR